MNKEINLIGVSGKIGSGKDTFLELLNYHSDIMIRNNYNIVDFLSMKDKMVMMKTEWENVKMAGTLKKVTSMLTGVDVNKLEDQSFKDTYLPTEWDSYDENDNIHRYTYREFMQKLGTESMRDVIHENVWVNATMSGFDPTLHRWCVTDIRFENEAKAIKDNGGILIRINRNTDNTRILNLLEKGLTYEEIINVGFKQSDIDKVLHVSETGLDKFDGFDYVIENNHDNVPDFYHSIKPLLNELNK